MDLVATIADAWGWIGLTPDAVVSSSAFGNLIVRDEEGRYWRLCPEDLTCRVVAESREALEILTLDQSFLDDWNVTAWVDAARSRTGPLRPGYAYCLKIPAALGGEYAAENFGQVPLRELVSFSGSLARQIKDVPDGALVDLKVVP